MKNFPAVASIINSNVDISARPRLIAEWNMNRYATPKVVNFPDEVTSGFSPGLFPIESIVEPIRPDFKGINKSRLGISLISHSNTRAPDANGNIPGRFYICDEDDAYKYWTSPLPVKNDGGVFKVPLNIQQNFPAHGAAGKSYTGGVSVSPTVIYNKMVEVNKVVVKFENTYSSPREFYIQVTRKSAPSNSPTSSDWMTIARRKADGSSFGLNSDWQNTGEIASYYNGDGVTLNNWTGTRPATTLDNAKRIDIRGIRVLVYSVESGYARNIRGTLNKSSQAIRSGSTTVNREVNPANSHVDIIEIGGRLEIDLSSHVISMSSSISMTESSVLAPIAGINKNQGTVSLSNTYKKANGDTAVGLFSRNNKDSPYYGLIDANVEFRGYIEYYDSLGASKGVVPEFVMYTGNWAGQESDVVDVDLEDFGRFFDEGGLALKASLWENLSVVEIICRILDSVGFNNYVIDDWKNIGSSLTIPMFWTDGEKTTLEVLNELSIAGQVGMFFNSTGQLVIRQRGAAFNAEATPTWTISSQPKSSQVLGTSGLSDLIELSEDASYNANKYKVTYTTKKWSEYSTTGTLVQEVVWEPEGAVTLRSSPLLATVTPTNTTLAVNEPETWPYDGVVNIDGEYIRYKGKGFLSFEKNVNGQWIRIDSKEQLDRVNANTPVERRHKNKFLGSLVISERGVWGTSPRTHKVWSKTDKDYNTFGWRLVAQNLDRFGITQKIPSGAWSLASKESRAIINTKGMKTSHFFAALRGDGKSGGYTNYGARMVFNSVGGFATQSAGIVFNHDGTKGNRGYYVELTPSRITNSDKKRKPVRLYSIHGTGSTATYNLIATADSVIVEGVETEVDITFDNNLTHHRFNIFINGSLVITKTMPKSGAGSITIDHEPSSLCGVWARGETNVAFEYFYGTRKDLYEDEFDSESFFDSIGSGNLNQFWDKVNKFKGTKMTYRMRGSKWYAPQTIIDDFGPYVHEVREFDIKFDPAPVQHSVLGLYNTWSATCIEYLSDPFGAKFIIANSSRRNAVLSGQDSINFTSDPVDVPFHVYGRVIVDGEQEEIIEENKEQIRRRGLNESVIDSPWVQTEEMAKSLAEWLRSQWSYGHQTVNVQMVGNPLIEVGDVVRVYYPESHIDAEFYVTETSTSFSEGVSTTLSLREKITE